MHIKDWAERMPDTPALIMAGSGETVTFAQMEARSNQGAHLLRSLGLTRGDAFALWSTNNARFHEITWAMQRSGLYMTPIASKLKAGEAAYIVGDCGARVLIVDAAVAHAADLVQRASELIPQVEKIYSIGGELPGVESWEAARDKMPTTPIPDESSGRPMIYSSGTTGRPKGVRMPLSDDPIDTPPFVMYNDIAPVRPGTAFVATAPMYHVGTLLMTLSEQQLGATIILLEKFDPELLLKTVDKYKPERSQYVPTMFWRMLKLPQEVRDRYDMSSLKLAIHSAAPCPVPVKHQMIEWWGPILFDIYGGTENAGATVITSHEWLKKPGSVGKRPELLGSKILDEQGDECPPNVAGTIYHQLPPGGGFTYYKD